MCSLFTHTFGAYLLCHKDVRQGAPSDDHSKQIQGAKTDPFTTSEMEAARPSMEELLGPVIMEGAGRVTSGSNREGDTWGEQQQA